MTGGYALWITLSLLALALLQLALIGLYSPHRQTVGSLGWVGFFLASMGIAFAFFIVLVYAALASPLIPDDPKLLKGAPPSMIVLYFPLFSAGWVLLGAAFLRIPFYPHWAVLLLAAGAVLAFEEAAAAEAFRVIEGLGPEWEVINFLQEVPGLLRSAARGEVRYVALDPPSAIRRREEELKLVSIVTFVDHLVET